MNINIDELKLNYLKLECKQNICKNAIELYNLQSKNKGLRFKGIKTRRLHINYTDTLSLSRRHLNQILYYFYLYSGK